MQLGGKEILRAVAEVLNSPARVVKSAGNGLVSKSESARDNVADDTTWPDHRSSGAGEFETLIYAYRLSPWTFRPMGTHVAFRLCGTQLSSFSLERE